MDDMEKRNENQEELAIDSIQTEDNTETVTPVMENQEPTYEIPSEQPVENHIVTDETPNVEQNTQVGEEPKKSNKVTVIILFIVLFGLLVYLIYDRFIKKDEPVNNNEKQNEVSNINDIEIVCDEETSECKINGNTVGYNVIKGNVIGTEYLIIKDNNDQSYNIVDKAGKLFFDANVFDLVFENGVITYTEPAIFVSSEEEAKEVVCGKYDDDSVVSIDYMQVYKDNQVFGEKELMYKRTVRDVKAETENLEEYCK